jgi:thiosulfate/3-mercaptopyruvate sulfurtransferase
MIEHTTLISAAALQDALSRTATPGVLVLDCSFDLANADAGEAAYMRGHVPGARYAHLNRDLSGPKAPLSGRHPLPDRQQLAQRLTDWGATDDTQLVAYDASGGMFAARLWWLARWLGHGRVAVLDGGLPAWTSLGAPLTVARDEAPRADGGFTVRESLVPLVTREQVLHTLGQRDHRIVDARAADRFRGENETLDPVGGHIPGASHRFFKDNLQPDGRFKPAAQLAAEWAPLLAAVHGEPQQLIMQCGSGVTACHNLMALELLGHRGAALYAGSWSEWVAYPDAPVAVGA